CVKRLFDNCFRPAILLSGLVLFAHVALPGGRNLGPAAGRNYYVDDSGNDAGDGSRAHPLKTIARGNRLRLQAGESVFFRGGQRFAGVLRIEGEGGSAERPVWIGVRGKEAAVIDGGDSSAVICYDARWVRLSGLRLAGTGRKKGNVKDGLAVIECE